MHSTQQPLPLQSIQIPTDRLLRDVQVHGQPGHLYPALAPSLGQDLLLTFLCIQRHDSPLSIDRPCVCVLLCLTALCTTCDQPRTGIHKDHIRRACNCPTLDTLDG